MSGDWVPSLDLVVACVGVGAMVTLIIMVAALFMED